MGSPEAFIESFSVSGLQKGGSFVRNRQYNIKQLTRSWLWYVHITKSACLRNRYKKHNFGLFTEIDVCKFLHGLVVVLPETFLFYPLYVLIHFSASFCTAHTALDLTRDYAPQKYPLSLSLLQHLHHCFLLPFHCLFPYPVPVRQWQVFPLFAGRRAELRTGSRELSAAHSLKVKECMCTFLPTKPRTILTVQFSY